MISSKPYIRYSIQLKINTLTFSYLTKSFLDLNLSSYSFPKLRLLILLKNTVVYLLQNLIWNYLKILITNNKCIINFTNIANLCINLGVMGHWTLTIFYFILFYFFWFYFYFTLFSWRDDEEGTWQGSHMTGHMMWRHRPRT